MAFQRAANYNNLPNGAWSPINYSKKVMKQFRKSSVVEDITNTDYQGEIKQMGDSVKIVKEPEILTRKYARGTQITPQDIEDVDFTMVVDQANYYAFKSDDIEVDQQHVNWTDLAKDRAAYKLRDLFDAEVLAYMSGFNRIEDRDGNVSYAARTAPNGTPSQVGTDADELFSQHKIGRGAFTGAADTKSVVVGTKGTFDATPLAILNRLNRIFNQKNVDQEGRWVVIDPLMWEILQDEDSKYINRDYNSDADALTNGKIVGGKIRGFRVYCSNSLPFVGTGAETTTAGGSATNYGVIIAGHDSAVSTAQTLTKSEKLRDTQSFGDIFRGMQVYGRKILRPEGLAVVRWNKN